MIDTQIFFLDFMPAKIAQPGRGLFEDVAILSISFFVIGK